MLAGVLFVAAMAGGIVYLVTRVRGEDPVTAEVTEPVVDASEAMPAPVADIAPVVEPVLRPSAPDSTDQPRSLETITWTVVTSATCARPRRNRPDRNSASVRAGATVASKPSSCKAA